MDSWHEKNSAATRATVSERRVPELHIAKAHVGYELRRRTPWMLFSVAAAVAMLWIGQSYEEILATKIHLAFFIPVIVYLSDSIGAETLALFVRELSLQRLSIRHLILKETFVGFSLGVVSGLPMGVLSYVWFDDFALAATVTCAMIVNGMVAVIIGMLLPVAFAKLGRDPAIGTDEITTALSDNLSILVYLLIATVMLFGM
jgi:magnesium transporter